MTCRKRLGVQSEDASELILSEEVAAEQARIKAWAKQTEELGAISNLLGMVQNRRKGLSEAYKRGLQEMHRAFQGIFLGNISADVWTLTLTLEQGDRDSNGTRSYALSVGDQGIKVECFGSEYTRGEGSDSWSGASFFFSPDKTREGGDFYSFINEFESAIHQTQDYKLSFEKNGDAAITETEEREAESERSREQLRERVVRQTIRELQEMRDASMLLSGPDSGLRDVWDEICVQRQTEESIHWTAYESTTWGIIAGLLDDLSLNQMRQLWLLTDAGESWAHKSPESCKPEPCLDDVKNLILDAVLAKALNHTNTRIRAYCDRRNA